MSFILIIDSTKIVYIITILSGYFICYAFSSNTYGTCSALFNIAKRHAPALLPCLAGEMCVIRKCSFIAGNMLFLLCQL